MSLLTRLLLIVLLLGAVLAPVSGCKRKRLRPDPAFSLNVMTVPEWWPREKKDWPKDPAEARVMKEALDANGRPDYLRIVWNRDRRLVRQGEMVRAIQRGGRGLTPPEFEWVYFDDNKVIRFFPRRAETRELDDRLKTVCNYGDPNEIKTLSDAMNREMDIFTYYEQGKLIYFDRATGRTIKEDKFQAIDGFERRQ